MTTFLSFLKGVPSWVWVALGCIAVLYFTDRNGYNRRKAQDAMRDSTAFHNADTIFVPYVVDYRPRKPQVVQGKVLPPPDNKELTELQRSKISDSLKIARYDSMLVWTSLPFESEYIDEVDSIRIVNDPIEKTTLFSIVRKPQTILVPEITRTLVPPPLAWYKTGTTKVIEGVISAGLIYGAIQSEGKNRLYYSMAGVTFLAISFAL